MNEQNIQSTQNEPKANAPDINGTSVSECKANGQSNPQSKKAYTTLESVGALLLFIIAFFSFKEFLAGIYPLGSSVVCILSAALTAGFMYYKRAVKAPIFSYYFLILAIAFIPSFIFSSKPILIFLSYCAFLFFSLLFIYFRCGSGTGKPKADVFVFDVGKAFFLAPFSSGANAFSAMLYPLKKGKLKTAGRHIKYIAAGLFIAVVPTAIVLSNLSFDGRFVRILSDIFVINELGFVFEIVFSLLFAIPLTLYIFSAVSHYNEAESEETKRITAEMNQETLQKKRMLPSLTVVSAAIPILFLYAVFFIAQFEDYTAAFSGKLPDGYVYSEYARSGFFELCRVAALNAAFIFCARAFTKTKNGAPTIALRVISSLICAASLVLIATAMSKMLLYIDAYGMTPKRVYVSLFMILMAAGFLICLVSQFCTRLKMTWICITLASLMLLIPSYANVDSFIASYNVDRYIGGTLDTLDYSVFASSTEASMPALLKLYNNDKVTESDKRLISSYALTLQNEYKYEDSVFSYSIPKLKAISAIEEILKDR